MQKIKATLKTIGHKNIGQLLTLMLIDIAFFGSTNISRVPSYLVIVGFLLFTYTLYTAIYHLLGIARLYGMPIRRKKRLSLYATGALGLLVALQSIGELSTKDVVLLLPLSLVGYVYLSYFKANEQKIS